MPNNRFTVYDVLEARGEFRKNPANVGAQSDTGEQLYIGPVEYPKMVFHPTGEERITVPGEVITTPLGAKTIGEQRELINKLVRNQAEEEEAISAGWHRHPSQSIAASGKDAPATGQEQTIEALKKQIEELQAQQKRLQDLQTKVNPMAKGPMK